MRGLPLPLGALRHDRKTCLFTILANLTLNAFRDKVFYIDADTDSTLRVTQGPIFVNFMSELIPVLAADEIHLLVKEMARRISADYRDRELVMIAVLKGSFVFLADLIRQLEIPVTVDFLQACSYGSGTQSCGAVRLAKDFEVDIRNKDVLLVEDIVDTGLTVNRIIDHLKSFQPLSVGVCTLIDKRERREAEVRIAYSGHVTEKGFLVGYGLDYAEAYRHLPGLFHLKL
jgi:hypoxanthine phosphoribosyltransferase